MARKSRKNLPQPEQAVISVQFPELDEGKIPTAIYGRLSVEDDEDMRIMWQARWIPKNINRSGKSIPDSMIACGQHCREQKQKRWK